MKARNVGLIMKKDLGGLLNEKTILLAILLQLFVAMFSSFLMVGLTTMYDPSALQKHSGVKYGIGYVGEDSGLRTYLENSHDFLVYDMELSPGIAALKERKLSAVVYIPDIPPDGDDPVKVTLYLLQNDIQAAIVNVKLKEAFLQYEEDLRELRSARLDILPISLEFPAGSGTDFYEFIYGLLIPLLLFMPAIISSALIIDLITEEYQQRTLETLLSTPMSITEVVWGKILACEVLVPIQAGAWLALLSLNGIRVENMLQILLQVASFSLVLILVGALVALYYRERSAAQFIFSTVVVVLMLLALTFPGNPLNLITLLATGTPVQAQWIVFSGVVMAAALLGILVSQYAKRSGKRHLTE
ncbi:MAG TPA: ABC transporter permease [Methanoregulaceae archaeon]|nr:ABC transporter permease [Methanoregulaceae archaeon]